MIRNLVATGRIKLAILLASLGYYLGAKMGFALTFRPHPVSTMWPPNTILLAALLLVPTRLWWILILLAFPAHLAAQLQSNVPPAMILCWFVSNSCEALIGAGLTRRLTGPTLQFDSFRKVSIFLACAAFMGPFVSSFVDSGFVIWNHFATEGYWAIWRMRFFANVLTTLTLVPVILCWATTDIFLRSKITIWRLVEAGILALLLSFVSLKVFNSEPAGPGTNPVLLYAPLPFLLWAAVRFGAGGASTFILEVALIAIWGAIHGQGPFSTRSEVDNALSIQLFLIVVSVPLLYLAAVIEERKQADEASRKNEERLRLALSAARMGTWDWNIETDSGAWSDESSRILGIDEHSKVSPDVFLSVVHPLDRGRISGAILRSEGGGTYEVEFRVVQPDQKIRWVLGKGEVLYDKKGKPVRMVGVNVDITDRKLAENALRSSEERFSKAFRSSPDALIISRQADSRIIEVNERWETIFGYTRDEAVGKTLSELSLFLSNADRDKLSLFTALSTIRDLEMELFTKEGNIRRTTVAREVIEVGGEPCYITIIRDITKQSHAESEVREQRQQLAHLTRVAILGELSGALAHELNQPLTAILSNAQAAQRFLAQDPIDLIEIREILEDVISEDIRAGKVIQRLRALLRKGEAQFQPLDLNEVAQEVLGLAHSELVTNHVTVSTQLAPVLPQVSGDRVQLQQVLLNLIVNASEAMAWMEPAERSLTVRSEPREDEKVHLSISDLGTGIFGEPDRVFEPFFTTKQHGLGLGLAICRSIVGAHGGQLWVKNNRDRGATFHIALPAIPDNLHT